MARARAVFLALACSGCTAAAPLLDRASFADWIRVGDAVFEFDGEVLAGHDAGARNSFLLSPREYSDFVLECEVRIEPGGNSGIQVRSHQRPDGTVFGYQIEIDPSDRAWSGGLYDEARSGWLDPLDDQPEARRAFRLGEWNRYRIECRGDRIRSWVNGVPCADFRDPRDRSGRIGFQVHGGGRTRVWWRRLRLRELT
ncbi:MAG: DUF1080 domain-containing protein [Planctomycetota bacterium]|nr:MAG: DUF1080 domain-containing protein [Planctomycetota bacterium]